MRTNPFVYTYIVTTKNQLCVPLNVLITLSPTNSLFHKEAENPLL